MRIMLIFFLLASCVSENTIKNTSASNQNVELGFAYLEQGKVPLAKTHFLLALQSQPDSVFARDGLAYYYEVVGEISIAERYYRQALNLKNRQGEAHNNYGAFLCRHEKYREGIEQFLMAIQDSAYTHVGSAYANASLCASLLQDAPLAKQYAKMAARYGVLM